ncbi:AAA family ATPase [uncultured Tateyamaria sp.]|uniref:AAA family ATPase n=1 Tax=uncultured Tateyamaria sp. TaxID=455651 RepID=UPI00260B07C5|nr:AAA family ATPase [uncultured Tateyamaria sp.]
MTILVALSGLPGVGKTTLAKALAAQVKAVHLRVDSVETALKNSVLRIDPSEDAGYLAIASVAVDNLLLGFDVIADTVNPIEITRNLWARTAASGSAHLLNVEVVCSDRAIHRYRVEARESDIQGLVMPDWQKVANRKFDPWKVDRLIVDTSVDEIKKCASKVVAEMQKLKSADR